MNTANKRRCHGLSLIIGLALASVLPVKARLISVTSLNDTTNSISLRGAIIDANLIGGTNIIYLGQQFNLRRSPQPAWIYQLTIQGPDENVARTGDLDITRGNLTIIGASSNVVIDATSLGDRVFQVFSNASLTLENLTIRGGSAPVGAGFFADGEPGGAICNAGTLILKNSIITNNMSGPGYDPQGNLGGTGGGDGGGIYNSGTLSAFQCQIVDNNCGVGVDGAQGGNGGGIRNDGVCFLTNCVIGDNQSGGGGPPYGNAIGLGGSGGAGGGIFSAGTLILDRCIVGDNFTGQGASGGDPTGFVTVDAPGGPGGSGGGGGGIYNSGQLQIIFSTVSSNSTGNGGSGGSFGAGGNPGAGGDGSGIYNAGELSLSTSTISGNFCGNGGSGGNGFRPPGADGGAGGGGSGIYNSGSFTITSCTITLNQAGAGGNGGDLQYYDPAATEDPATGGPGGDGGGILNDAADTNTVIRNTLIALNLTSAGGAGGTNDALFPADGTIGNPGSDGLGADVAGDFTSQGFNLISRGDGSSGFTNGIDADQVGTDANPIDPLLGPLQKNRAFTPNEALLPGSPAINQGNCFGIHSDQRGMDRPYAYPHIPFAPGGDGTDIGAVELTMPPMF